MTMLSIRSLCREAFRDLLTDLHGEHFAFDIIGISEVFRCDNDRRLKLPGFHDLLKHTRDDDSRGGVGLFIREHIKYKIREDLSIFCHM